MANIPPSRVGKVPLTIYVDPDFRDELKIAAIRSKRTVEETATAGIQIEVDRVNAKGKRK
jgi:hypothetical protein